MSMQSKDVVDPRIPRGFKVRFHEFVGAGTGSPDIWFESWRPNGVSLGEFPTIEKAIHACQKAVSKGGTL